MVNVRPTLPGDSWLVLADLRPVEVAEMAALGVTCEECIRIGQANSEAFTLFIAEEPAGIFGLMHYGDYVVPWGVFTRAIDRHPLPFLRFIRGWVRANVSMPAANYIDARNLRGIEWFNWLGFSVGDPVPYGLNDEPFREVRLN